jgi:glycosyltransferase involved in cell wall biosynthesis
MKNLLNIGPETPLHRGTTLPNALWIKHLEVCGYRVNSIDTSGQAAKIGVLRTTLYLILKVLKSKEEIVVIHVSDRSVYVSVLLGFFLFLRRKSLYIRFFGGNSIYHYENIFFYKLSLKLLSKFAGIIFFETKGQVSYFSRLDVLVNHWPNPREGSVIPEVLDINKSVENYYLFIGTCSVEKGISGLVEIAPHLEHPIYFVGNGPDVHKLEGVKNVVYLGGRKNEEVKKLMVNSIALVLPSTHYGEGQSGVIIEAMQLGKSVIAFEKEGFLDLIDYAGLYLVKMGDWNAICLLLRKVELLNRFHLNWSTNNSELIHRKVLLTIEADAGC